MLSNTTGKEGCTLQAITYHAELRARQRRYCIEELLYVQEHGRKLHRTGVLFYFLGERDLPPEDRKAPWARRLIGTTLLMSWDGATLITVYKNPQALGQIKRKPKYRIWKAREVIPYGSEARSLGEECSDDRTCPDQELTCLSLSVAV